MSDAVIDAPPAGPPAVSRRRPALWLAHAVALIALSFGLWAGCLWLFSLHNDFPPAYHPDERGKGYQILTGERNYFHPQLMLEAAMLILPDPATTPGLDVDTVVRRARVTSAAFGAGAAVLMAWAGLAAAGWAGFLGVGLAVGLCPALLSHAHYLKEDVTLLFGIAAVLCSGAWSLRVRRQGPQLWTVISIGIACGLAAAGKYCGVVMLGPGIVVAIAASLARRNWALAAAAPLLVCVFAATAWAGIDYRVFADFDHFLEGFDQEENHSVTGHSYLTMRRPNTYFIDLVRAEAMPHVKALAVLVLPALAVALWRRRVGWPSVGFTIWLAATGVVYSVMLAYSAIPFYRYTMPVTVMLYALAGLSVAWLAMLPRRPMARIAVVAVGVVVIGALQGFRCADYTNQFADDSHDALRVWLAASVPPDTAVAADNYANLDADVGLPPAPVRVVRTFVPAGPYRGTVDDLRADGVTYVITASSTCDRYSDPHVFAEPGSRGERTIAFYRDLKRYPIAWSRIAKHSMWTFTNPDMIVYRIDQPVAPQK